MRNIYPLKTARRRSTRLQKLGSKDPFCLWCGCTDPMLLRPVTRSFLEQHHPFGRNIDPSLMLALCFNCHALATEGLLQAGVSMTRESDPRKFAINAFRASEFHLKQLGEAQGRFATFLEQDGGASSVIQASTYQQNGGIISTMFRMAWPVWKVHRGRVPRTALLNLEKDGDWPRGTAAAIIERISRDEDLRFQLETGHVLR